MNNLTILPTKMTKAGIAARGAALADSIMEDGMNQPIEALVKLRAIKEAVDAAIKELEPAAMDQADQWNDGPGRGANVMGVRIDVRNGAAKWDYSHDQAWQEAKAKEAEAAAARKKREEFLKALEGEMVDPQTGEFVTPAVQTSLGSRSLALTFPKE